MRSGWIVFCHAFRVRFRTLLLYSIGVALSAATILMVQTLTALAASGVDRELDRVLLNGVQVRIPALTEAAAEDAVRAAAASLAKTPMPVGTVMGSAEGRACAVWGVGSCGEDRFSLQFCAGRFFCRREQDAGARVCVVSDVTARALFGTTAVIGVPVRLTIGNVCEPFRIVGVYSAGYAVDIMHVTETVYVPYTIFQHSAFRSADTSYWLAAQAGLTEATVRLVSRLGADCRITDYTRQRRQIRRAFDVVTGILTLISSVSLVVATFNLLVVTRIRVKGQVREIGLKKSLGATNRDLLWEYVFEAAAIAVIGSGIGIAIDAALCLVLRIMNYQSRFSFAWALGIMICAVCLSVLFCLWPAGRAVRMPPAQSLRREE